MDLTEYDYHSSVVEFEEFEKSSIWRDISYELEMWLKIVHESMEDYNLDHDALRTLQGNAEFIRKAMLLPEAIRNNIEAVNRQRELEREREDDRRE